MKKLLFVPLAALALSVSCGESTNPFSPTTEGSRLLPTPKGPVKDDIANNLDASVDAIAEVMPLTAGGANGTTTLYVIPTGNGPNPADGKSGCNITGSTTLSISISSSSPSVATVSPASVTFGSCGDTKTLTVTPVGVGSTTITIAQTSNNTGGTFTFSPATFTVNVTAPTPVNTPPSISVGGVTGGASYNKGSVPAATCNVIDAEDGNKSFAATLNAITGPYSSDGIGSQEASCSYTDAGGLTASGSVTYSIVDPSPPTIGYTLSPASPDGNNGWYKSNVTLTWNVADPQSPNSLAKTGCVDQNITSDQDATTYSCSATSAGGSAGPVEVTIKRDGTAPNTTATRSPVANGFGWNNETVTVKFNGTDAPSGIASCDADVVLASEGAGQFATGSCTDNAGNSSSATESNINIDLTAPNVGLVGGPANGASYYFGSVPAAPTCSASDPLSGLNGSCVVSGYSTAVGTHTVTATANDKAGNSNSASVTYTVLAWTLNGFYQPVDMDKSNTVKAGSTVPFKFEIFAGPTELTDVGAVKSFITTPVNCSSLTTSTDDIESTTTGGTSLRYDLTGGQFIQNWQTTGKPGVCFKVTMTTQDLSSLTAYFKLK